MAIDKKSLKKMFPNLYNELETGETKVPINAVRKNPEPIENAECEADEFEPTVPLDKLRHFNPTAVDFIRRCDTNAQAEEIITYLEKKGEITKEYAVGLRNKLKRDGVRCFGPKKEEYYYFKEGGIY
jgi:hypothetical protein